jgi:hypothetical protein
LTIGAGVAGLAYQPAAAASHSTGTTHSGPAWRRPGAGATAGGSTGDRLVDLQPRLTDVSQPLPRVAHETAADQRPDGRRRRRRQL